LDELERKTGASLSGGRAAATKRADLAYRRSAKSAAHVPSVDGQYHKILIYFN